MVSPTCLESWGMARKLCSTGTVPKCFHMDFLTWQHWSCLNSHHGSSGSKGALRQTTARSFMTQPWTMSTTLSVKAVSSLPGSGDLQRRCIIEFEAVFVATLPQDKLNALWYFLLLCLLYFCHHAAFLFLYKHKFSIH